MPGGSSASPASTRRRSRGASGRRTPSDSARDRAAGVVLAADQTGQPGQVEPGPGEQRPAQLRAAGGPHVGVRWWAPTPGRPRRSRATRSAPTASSISSAAVGSSVSISRAARRSSRTPSPPERSTGGGVRPQNAMQQLDAGAAPRARRRRPCGRPTSAPAVARARGPAARPRAAPIGRSPRSASPTCRGSSTVSASTRSSRPWASSRPTGLVRVGAGPAAPDRRAGGQRVEHPPLLGRRRRRAAPAAPTTPAGPGAGRPRPPGWRGTTSRAAGTSEQRAVRAPDERALAQRRQRGRCSAAAGTSGPSSRAHLGQRRPARCRRRRRPAPPARPA